MNLGDVMLSEKSKVAFNVGTFITVFIFVIVWSVSAGSWKTGIERDVRENKEDTAKNTQAIEVIKPAIIRMEENQKWMKGWMERREDSD